MSNISVAQKTIDNEGVTEIALQFVDIAGILHTLWIPASALPKVAEEGIHTDGSSLAKMVDVSNSDVKLVPDMSTFVVLPPDLFPQRIARIVCDIYKPESDEPFDLDPRFVLKQSIANARTHLGNAVGFYAASEIEFFLLNRTEDGDLKLIDEGRYLATPPADRGADLRLILTDCLRDVGVVVEKHHHEVPHGKSEFNIEYSDALRMADTIYLVKFLIKLLASRNGLVASFMPKPFHGEYGAGLHSHVSLFDDEKRCNLFSDPSQAHGLSATALKFLAGLLTHARGLAGITNPSVNSYKRLVPGWEAPVNISWARYNRSVLIRIPPGRGKATRLEYRPTDGSCNFYLAYAAILSAGLHGIMNDLNPPPPVEQDIYHMSPAERAELGIDVLPENLDVALKELSNNTCLREGLGDDLVDKFLQVKKAEWDEYITVVHEWERDKYLDV